MPFLWPLHDVAYDEFRFTPFALERMLVDADFCNIDIRASGGWDASLAQMIGLWLRRRPMNEEERTAFSQILYPIYEQLLQSAEREEGELNLAEIRDRRLMVTGLEGVALKEPLD